ncbi:MAG: PQQ-binding-like beta-propeller repeat protein [Gemmatimonadales bacterium]
MNPGIVIALAFALAGCGRGGEEPARPAGGSNVGWPSFGNDPGGSRYSPLSDINDLTVVDLAMAWTWRSKESEHRDSLGGKVTAGPLQVTPVVVDDTMYLTTSFNQAVALDAVTGRELWRFDPKAYHRPVPPGRGTFVHRGVALGLSGGRRRVFLATGARLIALDAATGQPIPTFGRDGEVDLVAGLPRPVNRNHYNQTSPPLVAGGLVVVGSSISDRVIAPNDPPGDVQAFDAETGRPVWRWSPIPTGDAPGAETWEREGAATAGHLNTWAPMAADEARGLLYLPVSTPSNDFYGGDRPGANRHAESLVCLDLATGALRWAYQIVRHGLWDYDPPAQPVLLTIRPEGSLVDAVAMVGKTGFVYVFDRVTGSPIWPIEDRPVPSSDVPGESASPTQPFPTKPAPFARQGFSEADLIDFTPELGALARARVEGLRLGPLFTPPSLGGTVVMPGWIGGAGWGGAAVDPTTGTLYVKATNRPSLVRLVPGDLAGATVRARFAVDPEVNPNAALDLELPAPGGLLSRFRRRPDPIPIVRPPYGTMTAIDMNHGVHRWQVPFGDTPTVRRHPALRHLSLPPLGVAGAPGPIVTAGGLIFATGGGTTLYALAAGDGRVRWSHEFDQLAYSIPMTFRSASHGQYLVVAVGGGARGRVVAFRVPARRRR